MDCPALYEAYVYNELEETEKKEFGLVMGETLSSVLTRIEEYYGTDNINSITIEWLYDSDVLPLTEELYNGVRKHKENLF